MYQNQTAAFRFLCQSATCHDLYIYIYMTVKSNMWTEAFKRCCLFAMGYLYECVYAQDNHGWCWWSWCIIIIRLEYRTDTLLKLCALSCSAVQFLIECSITLQTHKQGSCSSVCINGFCPVYSLLCFLQSFLFSQIGKVLAPSSSKIMQSTESTELLLEQKHVIRRSFPLCFVNS